MGGQKVLCNKDVKVLECELGGQIVFCNEDFKYMSVVKYLVT